MQTIGPYLTLQVLGTSQVGVIWSAADSANNQVTVAVLDNDAAQDPGIRSAFAATASSLEQSRQLSILAGDFAARAPWIASPTTDGNVLAQVFVTMGMTYQPVGTSAVSPDEATGSVENQPTTWTDTPPEAEVTEQLVTEGINHLATEHSVAEHSVAEHSVAEHSVAEHSVAEHSVTQQLWSLPQPGPGAPAADQSAPPQSAYQPVPPQPVPPPPAPAAPEPVPPYSYASPPHSSPPHSSPPYSYSAPPYSASSPPYSYSSPPYSAPPQSPPAPPQSPPQPPAAGWPQPTPGAGQPSYPPMPNPAAHHSRHRTLLLVGAVVLMVAVLGIGAGTIAYFLRSGDGGAEAAPTPGATSQPATAAAAPTHPGIEPPEEGAWPEDWPAFGVADSITPMTDLAGLGFSFEVPAGWSCTSITVTDELAHYSCGVDGGDQIGGDLIVRSCPDPCDGDRRVQMRMAEEAFGLQWVRDGGYRCWAETEELGGEPRYGLAMVGYWRSADESRIDRQYVLRMTAPVDQADDIRKIASSVRTAVT